MSDSAFSMLEKRHAEFDLSGQRSAQVTASRKRSTLLETIAFLSVIAIIGVNLHLAFGTINDLSQRHQSITNTGNIIVKIKDLNYAILAAESGQRGYLLTDDTAYLEPYHRALSVLDERITAVTLISTEIPGQQERIDRLLIVLRAKLDEMHQTINLANDDKQKQALSIINRDHGLKFSEEITNILENIEAQEFALQSRLYAQLAEAERDTRNLVLIFFLICLLLLVGAFIIQRKRLVVERRYHEELMLHAGNLEDEVAQRTQELELYSEELSRSNRELEDFAFVASHDLQEPLRKVRAFSSRIKKMYEDKLDEKGVDYLARMDKAAERMSALIQDLLAFSRIKTRGKEFVEVNLNEIVGLVVDDLEFAIESSGAQIDVSPLPLVQADIAQMNQLFINLLSNAIKFRREGVAPKIHIDCELVGDEDDALGQYHKITVTDNGIGFDQSYHDKIFLPFQRLHAREEYDGTGIGLAVCRRIVERHGGTLSAESRPGEGTKFIILLPLVVVDLLQS